MPAQGEGIHAFTKAATLAKTVNKTKNVFKSKGPSLADKVVSLGYNVFLCYLFCFQADTQGKVSYAWMKNKRER